MPAGRHARLIAPDGNERLIDYLALALVHGLLVIALLRLVVREDLDADPPPAEAPANPGKERISPAEARRRRKAGRA